MPNLSSSLSTSFAIVPIVAPLGNLGPLLAPTSSDAFALALVMSIALVLLEVGLLVVLPLGPVPVLVAPDTFISRGWVGPPSASGCGFGSATLPLFV